MKLIRYVFLGFGLIWAMACSQAIPVVTTLSPAATVAPSETSVESGGGNSASSGGTYKIHAKIGGGETVLSSSSYKIYVNGDN